MTDEVWILGATGRTGRAIARRLDDAGIALVLVGRDEARLAAAGAALSGAPRTVAGPLPSALARLADDPPAAVVNTVGPFTTTAHVVARSCPPGTHYLDLSNELPAAEAILALDAHARRSGQTFVTGAGFGVLSTESVVRRLCAGQPRPTSVRVDALPSVDADGSVVGAALAASVVQVLKDGGREVRDGRLVHARTASHPECLTTPAGEVLTTASGPNGELIAAWRASGADEVVAASTAVPSSAALRTALPALEVLLRAPGVARAAAAAVARIRLEERPRTRPFSWAHARVEWQDRSRDGWLRIDDANAFTATVAAEVTRRLLVGQGSPGAHTPGSLFGDELAEAAGGEFIVDAPSTR